MKTNFYYDFADEVYQSENEMIKTKQNKSKHILTTWIELLKDDNEYNKKKGNYITLEIDDLENIDSNHLINSISKEIEKLMQIHHISKKKKILVVGLGNDDYNSDALGPRVVDNILITSHLLKHLPSNTRSVSSFKPGVMSKTGLESSNMVKALKDKEQFSLIIVIDSLATTSVNRLYKVIQITDTGISPGSGVLNHRLALDKDTLGCPIICIGIATVLESAFLIYDYIKDYDENITPFQIREKLESNNHNYIVTSKEIDRLINELASYISKGINKALNSNL